MQNYSFILFFQDGSVSLEHQAANDLDAAKVILTMNHSKEDNHVLDAENVSHLTMDEVERALEIARANPEDLFNSIGNL